jgi:HSP20 family protein
MTKEERDDENEERRLARRGYHWDWTWPDDLLREMDRMFEPIRPAWRHRLARSGRPWMGFPSGVRQPPVDIKETADSVIVTAELPGIEKGSVDVQVSEESIEIKGEMKDEETEEGDNYYRRERSYSSIYRELALPAEVVPDKATAKMKDGILEVTVPKVTQTEQDKKKKVEVK